MTKLILVELNSSFKNKSFYCKKIKDNLPPEIKRHFQLANVKKNALEIISGATTTPNHSKFKSQKISNDLIIPWYNKHPNHTGQFFTVHTQQYVVKSSEGKNVFTEMHESSEYMLKNYPNLNLFVKDNKLLKNPIRTYVEVLTSSSLENKDSHKTAKQSAKIGSKKKLDLLLQQDNIKNLLRPRPLSLIIKI